MAIPQNLASGSKQSPMQKQPCCGFMWPETWLSTFPSSDPMEPATQDERNQPPCGCCRHTPGQPPMQQQPCPGSTLPGTCLVSPPFLNSNQMEPSIQDEGISPPCGCCWRTPGQQPPMQLQRNSVFALPRVLQIPLFYHQPFSSYLFMPPLSPSAWYQPPGAPYYTNPSAMYATPSFPWNWHQTPGASHLANPSTMTPPPPPSWHQAPSFSGWENPSGMPPTLPAGWHQGYQATPPAMPPATLAAWYQAYQATPPAKSPAPPAS